MDYSKSYIFNPLNNNLKQAIKKQYTIESKNNTIKRKSDDIHFYNFLSKYKHVQKYKINKIPKNQRFSYEVKNAIMPNIIKTFNNTKNKNKNESATKKDSKYYLNLVNGIYLEHPQSLVLFYPLMLVLLLVFVLWCFYLYHLYY